MENVILIGMPSCGKSTIGVILAKTLGLHFVDTDLVIQSLEGRLLQEIIDEDGLDYFFRAEEKAILAVSPEKPSVIATGGSVVYSEKAMLHLKTLGKTVYIKLPLDEIKKRLTNIKTRGVAINKGQTIDEIYDKRIPLYERYADITVDANGKSFEEIIGVMSKLL